MKKVAEMARLQDKTVDALRRVVDHAVEEGNEAQAYLCTLQLPRQFSENQHQANDIYKKIQSDFCKNVMRKTGQTPRYITVRTENAENPEYALCLITKQDAALDKPEEYAEKAMEIANTKCGKEGWGHGKLDLIELFRDAPKFKISHNPIQITQDNRDSAIGQLHNHLQSKSQLVQNHQRTLFVSKCK